MTTINELFPEKGKVVLTGSGQELIKQLGVQTVRQAILAILCGENIRQQTEPLTRKREAIVTGAMVMLFAKGWQEIDNFTEQLSHLAEKQLVQTPQSYKELIWPAQWLIGLTDKGVQNILRDNNSYIQDFEAAIAEAAQICETDFGPLRMNLGFLEQDGQRTKNLGWQDIIRLTTAIGTATLSIRGSEKSLYGKFFEPLVLGSALTILGFQWINHPSQEPIEKAFWLSDSSDLRECDATVRLRAGKLVRFDMGFIGKGNPEVMKDKLTRFASEVELQGKTSSSHNIIIVDKMPETTKTLESAQKSGSDIVQMSMQFWPQEVAELLKKRSGYEAEILHIPEPQLRDYLAQKMVSMPILDFLSGGVGKKQRTKSVKKKK